MRHRLFIIGLFITYTIFITAFFIWKGIGITPDRFGLFLFFGSVIIKKTRSFVLDWLPFLFILITYDFLRGYANNLNGNIHFLEMINIDKFLFHSLPTQILQATFYHPNAPQWYDYLATIFYFLHFALPLSFGFLLWLYNKNYFRQFITGITLLSYAGWITYIAYPAAPPWLAQQRGYIQGVSKILDVTTHAFPDQLHMPTIYQTFNSNPVAAIPSLHAAYPFLVLLFGLRFFKKKFLLFIPYVLGVWISIVYAGEHYVADVIIGALYATVFYFLTINIFHNQKFLFSLKKILP